MVDTDTALGPMTVLEVGSGVAVAYAGKLLADLGAEVTLVEPPGGTPLRRRPPRFDTSGRSALFEHLAGGKRSVTVAPAEPDGAAAWAGLLAGADVVLTDGTFLAVPPDPHPANRGLLTVDVCAFGRQGPYSGWHPSDLAVWALGGYLQFTGDPGREPLWLPGSQAGFHAGTQAAFAALVGWHERQYSGTGQRVEVSELASVLCAHAWLVSSWAACGQPLGRVPSDLIRASDGWVYVMRIVPNDNLFVLIERPDLAEEALADDLVRWFDNLERIFAAVAEWAAGHTVAEIVELGQLLRIAVTPVLDARGVRNDVQLAHRSWWEQDGVDADAHDGPVFPGQPYHFSATPARRRGRAPAVGERAARPTGGTAAPAAPFAGAADPPPAGGLPLAGLRVVEVTNNWAGPLTGRMLGDLGADVVKVEWATKPAARALFWPGPTQDRQRQGHHRAMYFNEMNRNKRDVVIDLATPRGREVFLDLVADADVLIENNSARVMGNLGLDWTAVKRVNPRLVMVSMSGYGADGPQRDWLAYGSNIETTSGLTSVTGYPDGLLSRTTLFYADPVAGVHGAVAVLAALEWRRRSGEGQWIEMSLNECGAAFNAAVLTTLEATGTVPGPAGNRDDRFAPHGVYRCIGDDHWVAIACPDDEAWPALASLMGRPDLAADPALATLEGRRARHDELDAAIEAWTNGFEQYELAHACQAAGVSAAPVLANWQILADPHIHRSGLYQPFEHAVVGVYPTTTWPWTFSRSTPSVRSAAPLFGQHNRQVLAGAGLDEAAIDELYATGVTADEPAV